MHSTDFSCDYYTPPGCHGSQQGPGRTKKRMIFQDSLIGLGRKESEKSNRFRIAHFLGADPMPILLDKEILLG